MRTATSIPWGPMHEGHEFIREQQGAHEPCRGEDKIAGVTRSRYQFTEKEEKQEVIKYRRVSRTGSLKGNWILGIRVGKKGLLILGSGKDLRRDTKHP